MPIYNVHSLNTQNDLLLQNLMDFYHDQTNLQQLIDAVNGSNRISLRIIDWFVTNYAKKNYTIYEVVSPKDTIRFKVYNDYKLKLKAYSKKRFDPFCRWERIQIPYKLPGNETEELLLETTIGQLNFFKWAIENHILKYIEDNYTSIETDMNARNTSSKRRNTSAASTESFDSVESEGCGETAADAANNKTRKKREELSVLACKGFRRETVKIMFKFS
jgi:hypothetical protein